FSSRRRHTRSLRDWSSDVCSSDLHRRAGVVSAAVLDAFPRAKVTLQDFSEPMIASVRETFAARAARMRYALCDLRDPAWEQAVEIGRASCREREEVTEGGGSRQRK